MRISFFGSAKFPAGMVYRNLHRSIRDRKRHIVQCLSKETRESRIWISNGETRILGLGSNSSLLAFSVSIAIEADGPGLTPH